MVLPGGIAVTLGDSSKSENASNPILGDIFAIISALLYGLYITSLKKVLPKQQDTNMTLLLGHMGLMMASVVGCLMWILHWLKIVNAVIPRRVFFWAVVKGMLFGELNFPETLARGFAKIAASNIDWINCLI